MEKIPQKRHLYTSMDKKSTTNLSTPLAPKLEDQNALEEWQLRKINSQKIMLSLNSKRDIVARASDEKSFPCQQQPPAPKTTETNMNIVNPQYADGTCMPPSDAQKHQSTFIQFYNNFSAITEYRIKLDAQFVNLKCNSKSIKSNQKQIQPKTTKKH